MTAEDKIHLALATALAVVAGGLVLGRDPLPAGPSRRPSEAAATHTVVQISRAELDAAIAPLRAFVQRRLREASTPSELALALHGLGPAALETDPERLLARISTRWVAPGGPPDSVVLEALGTLLEAGVPLERQLQTGQRSASLRELVDAALSATGEAARQRATSHWELDLLALATLAGMSEHSERLARSAHAALQDLELSFRDASALRKDADTLAWRDPGEIQPDVTALEASAAVFRAVAVLDAHDLDVRARRHLAALSLHYQAARALFDRLLPLARSADEKHRVHLAALERLGRLEEALYLAHLGLRRGDASEPAPGMGRFMRQVARDLLDHWSSARASGRFDATADRDELQEASLRAAVHALRGLRTARIAA